MKTGDLLYLHHRAYGVMTGHVFKRRRRWWFKADAEPRSFRLSALFRGGWEQLKF